MFKNKKLLITGGTGSFGNAVLRRFLASDIAEIRIFSRDEKKQEDMRIEYRAPFREIQRCFNRWEGMPSGLSHFDVGVYLFMGRDLVRRSS